MNQVTIAPRGDDRSKQAVTGLGATLPAVSRRNALQILAGASILPILPRAGLAAPNLHIISRKPRKGIIVVMDITIPSDAAAKQFDNFRSKEDGSSSFIGRGMYTGGNVGDKALAKSCADTCNYWIHEMKQEEGVEKVLVLVWTRRYGPMLTVPLKTKSDFMMVRCYGPPTTARPPLSRTASVDPVWLHLQHLEQRMVRNGRPFILTVEAERNFVPLKLDVLNHL